MSTLWGSKRLKILSEWRVCAWKIRARLWLMTFSTEAGSVGEKLLLLRPSRELRVEPPIADP
jgi:hypothetical protein